MAAFIHPLRVARNISISLIASLLVVFSPATAMASDEVVNPVPAPVETTIPAGDPAPVDPVPVENPIVTPPVTTTDPAPTTPTEAPPAQISPITNKQRGPGKPPGADGNSYVYNPATGMWENGIYAWNPNTNQVQPLTSQGYSYNPSTGMWDTTKWVYSPESGTYKPNIVSVPAPPAGTARLGNTAVADTPALNLLQPSNSNTINTVNGNGSAFNLFFDASISNQIISVAKTGDAGVIGNTIGGNATTGTAQSMANIINLLQSTTGFLNGDFTTFSSDINGDIQGDIFIDPNAFAQVQNPNNPSLGSNLTINSEANGLIDNEIVLDAGSGNAAVKSNTSAGNATSGNADAVANVVNIINSALGAGNSFLGVLNIYGNLNGDILLPPAMLDSLLASNVPRTTLNTANIENSSLLADFNTTQNINNNVNLDAASGNANVSHNTTAGNATTGNAQTNLTLLNLTGRQVVGDNALLVFVNVLGEWVGLIMDAPGSTAAALGGGISQNSAIGPPASSAVIKANETNTINNDITLNAASGDANVSNNTAAGNATTGNATASANIANITNSSLNLSGWLGIMFINVFGTWNGSFGVNTSAGDPIASAAPAAAGGTVSSAQVFRFVPTGNGNKKVVPAYGCYSCGSAQSNQEIDGSKAILASANGGTPSSGVGAGEQAAATSGSALSNLFVPATAVMLGLGLLAAERLLSSRQQRRATTTLAAN